MFKSILSRIPERGGDVLGLALVSLDGIAIEKVSVDPRFNFDTLIAEFTDRMKKIIQSSADMGTGSAQEMVVFTDRAVVILRNVHEDYYILCAARPDGMHGRVRHAIRMAIPELAQELA